MSDGITESRRGTFFIDRSNLKPYKERSFLEKIRKYFKNVFRAIMNKPYII